ncbi:MAG: acetyl-CoA decarbonylase/synthase complex subunit gamma [Thermoplasmata archaeon]|nr:acetyl-CoA decarbonylase/synthase complex subunit gamma [Thermoplasmata archaeon]TFG70990.1 MAG: acetyl-CoA decarbonylase/synthase complex subunit gamma [Methanomassiliicoccus sp.]
MPTAMEIYKLLPKKNCGECKFPTCLAFAMQLANQKVALEACPYVSPEAKAALEESGAPPIRLITFGTGDMAVKVGDETQLFRHDKTFYNPTVIGLIADDSSGSQGIKDGAALVKSLSFERVGQNIRVNSIAIRHSTGDPKEFLEGVKHASSEGLPMVLMTEDPGLMGETSVAWPKRPLLYRATPANFDAMVEVAKRSSCPLVIGGAATLDELSQLSERAKKAGVTDIVLEPVQGTCVQLLESMTVMRRAAVKKHFRPLGYPTISVLGSSDLDKGKATIGVAKYSSIVLMDELSRGFVFPLMVLRQNIFTDPQVPIQVKPGLYKVGEPNEKSPVMFTTNFSLTYFTVRADIEKSKMPAWLLVIDTEGQSVMTAFAAGKLTPESVTEAIEKEKVKDVSKRNEIVIPGMVSRMSGKLNELSGMKVIVGSRESSGIPKMIKSFSG